MEDEYSIWLKAHFGDKRQILGITLKPLSLGHVCWLDWLGVYPALTPEQIVTAALICSRECEDIEETLCDPWLEWKLRFWYFRYSGFSKIDWIEEGATFARYYEESTNRAPSIQSTRDKKDSKPDHSGTPFIQHLKATLQSRLNYTPAEAMNAPYLQAIWDYYSFHEAEGNIVVVDRKWRKEMADTASASHEENIREAVDILTKKKRE